MYYLYCIVLSCLVLSCLVLSCLVLYCIALYCIVLYCIVLYCIVLLFHFYSGLLYFTFDIPSLYILSYRCILFFSTVSFISFYSFSKTMSKRQFLYSSVFHLQSFCFVVIQDSILFYQTDYFLIYLFIHLYIYLSIYLPASLLFQLVFVDIGWQCLVGKQFEEIVRQNLLLL